VIYLREDQFYYDLYDLLTIESCLWTVKRYKGVYEKEVKTDKSKLKDDRMKALNLAVHLSIYYKKGERYRHRKETVEKWITKDRNKQDKHDNTLTPSVDCVKCGSEMFSSDKSLHDFIDEPLRVLFFTDCPKCKHREAYYDDGEKHVSKPNPYPKCNADLDLDIKKIKPHVFRWITFCKSCDYRKTETHDHKKDKEKRRKKEIKDKKLLEKYRSKYCLSEKEGQDYVIDTNRMMEFVKDMKHKEKNKTHYKKARSLKKPKVAELEAILDKAVTKQKYTKLEFSKPDLGKHLIVEFAVQDADSKREEYKSRSDLKKTITTTLKNTNWRLMSEGIRYRLGYLTGRIKGYESEDELMRLVRKNG